MCKLIAVVVVAIEFPHIKGNYTYAYDVRRATDTFN